MRKTTKAEAGKLGGLKSKETTARKKQDRIDQYMKNPKSCKQCGTRLGYDDRNKNFCNSSCAATYNNLRRENRVVPVTWNCLNCGKEHTTVEWRVGTYCDNACQQEYQSRERIRLWLEEGKDWKQGNPAWAKRYLQELRGEGCEICGIVNWNDKPIVLELDHIDGNHLHNDPNNLRVICPNCHSQTDTYKAKNTGNGRKYRLVS